MSPAEGPEGPDLADAFGVVLEGTRMRQDLTLAELAGRTGIKPSHLCAMERGLAEPALSLFVRLSVALGVSPAWLLEEVMAWSAFPALIHQAQGSPAWEARMRAIGEALLGTMLSCSRRELTTPSVMGERLTNQLALAGLMVTAIPTGGGGPSRSRSRRPDG